jgi:hypothetical protein
MIVIRIVAIELISSSVFTCLVDLASVYKSEVAILNWHELFIFNEILVLIVIVLLGLLTLSAHIGKILLLVLAVEPEAPMPCLAEIFLVKLNKVTNLG